MKFLNSNREKGGNMQRHMPLRATADDLVICCRRARRFFFIAGCRALLSFKHIVGPWVWDATGNNEMLKG